MASLIKLAVKLSIVGGAVYVTVNNSIWDKNEYAENALNKVKKSLPETTELLKELPSTNQIAEKWNEGAEKTFDVIIHSKEHLSTVIDKAKKLTEK